MKFSLRPCALCLVALLMTTFAAHAAAPKSSAPIQSQYIFINRAPEFYDQNKPETINDALFDEPLNKIAERGTSQRRLGLSFIFSYLDGPPDA